MIGMSENEILKRRLKEANELICELCEKCGENVCKSGEECDWKESEVQGNDNVCKM